MTQSKPPAYDELYLNDVMKVHRYLFELIEQCREYDTLSMIDSYMRFSPIRQKMDTGNWSALNKSGKQLFNDIPLQFCETAKSESGQDDEYDDILLGWMADMYVLMQWTYNLPSPILSSVLPAAKMMAAYHPLHETSYRNACEKLYRKYFMADKVSV